MGNIFANYARNTAAPVRMFTLADVYTPKGAFLCETDHYAAFEISAETDDGGFIATVYAKRDNGRYATQPTRFCCVRSVVADQLANLENARKGR